MKRFWIVIPLILLNACLGVVTPEPLPTETATSTPSPTATIEWFPPTSTAEIIPTNTVIPTKEFNSEVGEIIFRDDFNSPDDWTVPQTDRGQINISNGEIYIIINQPDSLLVGTREKPDFQNYFVEITANPILCSENDEYGFLFRVLGRERYYRFSLSCAGEVKLDKVTPAGVFSLQPWMRSASVPVGAPSISKLEVLALNNEFRIFINGDPQFTVSDQELQFGAFGVFARSVGEKAVTVSFSDLIVREVNPK
jgi:hypothetical protein